MIQNTDPATQQNYFSPTQIADTDASLANFRIDVATTQTANSFCVGGNTQDDKKSFDDATFQTIDSTTGTANVTINSAAYVFAIDINNDPTNSFNELLLAVNNSQTDQTLNLTVSNPNITRYAILVTDFHGDGDNTKPIPTTVSIYNTNNEVIWSFGELIQHPENDYSPLLVYTINNSSVRKSFVNFDIGTMNVTQTRKINKDDKK